MALTNPSATWLQSVGPAKTGQILVGGPGMGEFLAYYGTAESTGGDGADTAFDVNYVDGTETLPFTPRAVLISRIPATTGANEAAASIVASVTAITNIKFTVTLSAAPASGKDIKFGFVVFK